MVTSAEAHVTSFCIRGVRFVFAEIINSKEFRNITLTHRKDFANLKFPSLRVVLFGKFKEAVSIAYILICL